MNSNVDAAIIHKKMQRRLTAWRVVAVVAFIAALLIAGGGQIKTSGVSAHNHIMRVRVSGIISSQSVKHPIEVIDEALKDDTVKALILDVNSPGGGVTAGVSLHNAVERFAKKKPVVVTMEGVAASAGYMISVPAERIFSYSSTLTGSIGVLMQSPDISGLLDKVGVSMDELVSGPLKGQPSVVKPLSPAGREMLQTIIMDLYDQFVDIVARGRHMSVENVKKLADGRPYTGRQALSLHLVDQLGDEHDAKAWLVTHHHLDENIDIEDAPEKDKYKWLSQKLSGQIVGDITASLRDALADDQAQALWKP